MYVRRSFLNSVMTHSPSAGTRNLPLAPQFDHLLRYEASLEWNFDRTLSQLECVQRMRLGQPVLPKLEVQHSVS